MDTTIRAALMAALVVAATWPLANWAKSLPWHETGIGLVATVGSIQRGISIDASLLTDEDLLYGD
jgi:hypothetical protein